MNCAVFFHKTINKGEWIYIMINNIILKKATKNVNGDYSSLKLLGGFNDSVYEVKINNKSFIMKFFLASKNKKSLIKGELDWINYLWENGMNVAKPVYALGSNFINEIKDNNLLYYYVVFEKVEGNYIDDKNWEKNLIQNWGQSMGKMHNLAKGYRALYEEDIINWTENDILLQPPKIASNLVLKKWNKYLEKLSNLPTSKEYFGVIHNDLHHKNILFNNEEVQLFDFGDIEYSWFSYDIAICLYHAVQGISFCSEKEKLNFAYKVLKKFIKGYKLENTISDEWIHKINFFLDYRQIYSYLYFLKHLDIGNINEDIKEILERMKYNIENDISYIQNFNIDHVI